MLYLHGMGHFHPENVITNDFLEDLDIGSSKEWIMERVGIRDRHTVLSLDYIRTTKNSDPRGAWEGSLYTNAQTGALAARMAIDRAGIDIGDIGMVVSGSTASDHVCPAEAATVAGELGIDVPCFDINSACSTFGMQISILSSMREETLPSYVLVVNPECMTKTVDYSDRRVAPLFGDASSAAVVSATVPSPMHFESCSYTSEPSAWDRVKIPRMGHFWQNGSAVQGFAIRRTTDFLRILQKEYPINSGRFKFVGHQANLGMLRTVCARCDIPAEDHWSNVADFGNTGCAGAPSVLSQHWDNLHGGHHIAIVVVGAGLTWARVMLRIDED